MSGLDWQMVARREVHPARVAILEALAIADGPRSPKQLADYLEGQTLGRVSYHVRELVKVGLLELVDTKPRRGAVEHFYRLAEDVARCGRCAAVEMLAEFHEHPNALGAGTNTQALRRALQDEEHAELMHELDEAAAGRANLSQIAREIADVLYVTYGTAWAFGIDADAALGEIHRAAMDKMDAGLRREDGKILKPPGFVPPDMSKAIVDARAE